MIEPDRDDDVDDLIFKARTLSDRLAVVSHSHALKYAAITLGLAVDALAILAAGLATFGDAVHAFRYSDVIYRFGPVLLMFALYIGAVLCVAFYRLSLDRMYLHLILRRLDGAIAEAQRWADGETLKAAGSPTAPS